MSARPTCKTCVWWVAMPPSHIPGPREGACTRYAPTRPATEQRGYLTPWSLVSERESCGDHAEGTA